MRSVLMIIFLLFEVASGFGLVASNEEKQGFTTSSDQQDAHFLMRNTFALRTSIKRLGDDSHPFVSIDLKERYSFDQRRARIFYQAEGAAGSDFIYEAETGASIDYKVALESCEKSSLDDLFRHLYRPDSEVMLDLLTSPREHSHVVGPAKLLSIVCSEAQDLTQNYWPAGERQMRNMPTIEFMLRTKTNRARFDTQMLIYYAHDTFAQDRICQLVPLQILVKFPDKGHSIVVDYFEYGLEDENTFTGGTKLDAFAFPVGLDCLQSFESKVDLFSKSKLDKFSFEASVRWQLGLPMRYFVAYDRRLGMMRVNVFDDEKNCFTRILLDFNLNRTSTCSGTLEDSNCFTTQVAATVTDVSQLLFGANESMLSYMGQASVRNIKAHVFEMYLGNVLPLWFLQPTLVKHGKDYKLRYPERLLEDSGIESYVLTVYTTAYQSPGEQDAQILQLDIHNLNQQTSLSCVLSAQLYNFHLVSTSGLASNDLTQRNIFSIDFEENSRTNVELVLGGDIDLNLKRDYRWLNNWITRNDVILTSLVESLELPAMFIHNLESRLDKTSISLSFTVAEPSLPSLYTFSYLGRFEMNKEVDLDNFIELRAQALSGCLGLLDKCQLDASPVFLFYSERRKRCLMNAKLTTGGRSGCSVDLRKLDGVFEVELRGHGEIYMIEWQPDLAYKKQVSLLEDSNFHQLEESTVTLRDPDDVESEELQLDIKRVKVVRNRKSNGSGGFTISGYGLPVQPSAREAEVGSLQQCEVACLRDTNCRIYSYCVRHGQAHCMLSNVNISDDQTAIDELDGKLKIKSVAQVVSGTETNQLKIERDSRCQLNQKLYLDLFFKTLPEEISLKQYEVIPVSSREDCAELCFSRSLKMLQEVSAQKFCSSFRFLDNRMLNDWQDQAFKLLMDGKLDEHLLCLLDSDVERDLDQDMGKNNADFVRRTLFKPESFKFDYTTLYEQAHGFSLVNSSEEAINDRIGKNYQLETSDGLNSCAERCFAQNANVACNSFDYFTSNNKNQITSCRLNTLSLNSIGVEEREKLISRNKYGENVNKWHYEFRFHNPKQLKSLSSDESDTNSGYQPHSFWIGLVTFSSIISGMLLAHQLDRRLKLHLSAKLDSHSIEIQLDQQ